MSATAIDRHTWAGQVVLALSSLPPTQADALRLLYFQQLSERDVAARLGIALHEARGAAAEGLRRLGEVLRALPRA